MHPFLPSRRKFLALSAAALASRARPAFADGLPPIDLHKDVRPAAAAVNGFAADLYRRLAGRDGDEKGNLLVSPLGIETALAMTSAGARGKTLEEMQTVLHLPADPHPAFGTLLNHLAAADKTRPYELSVANAIWGQQGYPWEKDFLDLTRKHYGAGLTAVDFARHEAARTRINEWVAKETKERIKELVAPGVITGLTRMVLANAVHFKSDWLYRFDKKNTKDAPFTRGDGTKADVPLMALSATLNYAELALPIPRFTEKVRVLELPYAGKELSMLVFLPADAGGVLRASRWLTADVLANTALKPTAVKVSLPRFKAESALGLKPVLTDLGMKAAFAGGADFTGLSPKGKELFIGDVVHKAFVDVNEEGTEAAAATAVEVAGRSAAAEPKAFRADRPFVYAIRDTATGAVLFLGRYVGPA